VREDTCWGAVHGTIRKYFWSKNPGVQGHFGRIEINFSTAFTGEMKLPKLLYK
jgi:hypothetical protein